MCAERKVYEKLYIQFDKEVRSALHVVRLDPDAKGGTYRQIISAEGFINRMMNHHQWWDGDKFMGYRIMDVRYSTPTWTARTEDALITFLHSRWSDPEDKVLPVHRHANLWDFYKAIDYDHVKRKLRGETLVR